MSGINIKFVDSTSLGRCYSRTTYEIHSTRPIDSNTFISLVDLGFMSNGQGRGIKQIVDGKEVPVPDKIAWDTRIPPSVVVENVENGRKTFTRSYVYKVEILCDSGD